MVNAAVTSARDAERALAIGYAPAGRRAALAALLALDARLGEVVGAARSPIAAQLRLAWWRDALAARDTGRIPGEPTLAAIAEAAPPLGVTGRDLVPLCDGWEHLLADPLDGAAIAAFARERGGALFRVAARLLGGEDRRVALIGEGWALADLGGRLSDAAPAIEARSLAAPILAAMFDRRWPRALRPLGALALSARADLAGAAPGSPRRVARLIAHRLTGR